MQDNQNNTPERDESQEEQSIIGRRLAAQSPHRDEEKPEPASLTKSSPFLRWLDNFWYHHKWKTIVISFFVVMGIIVSVQFINRPTYDTSVVMASPYLMSKNERAEFEQLLNSICPQDFDGNGKKTVNIMDYQIYVTEAEIESDEKAYASLDDHFTIDRARNQTRKENFYSYIKTGESSVCILSRELYSELRSSGAAVFKPLSELYPDGNLPEGALEDGYGIRLYRTDFYVYNPTAHFIPDDAILCILNPVVIGKNNQDKYYARDLALFHAIADFRVSEEGT